jgi:hypothetical protein
MNHEEKLRSIEALLLDAVKAPTWYGTRDGARAALYSLQAAIAAMVKEAEPGPTREVLAGLDAISAFDLSGALSELRTIKDGLNVAAAPAAPAVAPNRDALGKLRARIFDHLAAWTKEHLDGKVEFINWLCSEFEALYAAPAPAEPKGEQQCTCGGGLGHTRTCTAFDESMMRYEPFAKPEQRAATLSPQQIEEIMEQAQVFASAWSLVGGVFDHGDALETAEQEKANLRALLAANNGGSNE